MAGGGTGALTGGILADLRKRFHTLMVHADRRHRRGTGSPASVATMTTSTANRPQVLGSVDGAHRVRSFRRPGPVPQWWRDASAAALWGILLVVAA